MAKYNQKLTPELSKKFCEILMKGHSINAACGKVGIVRKTFYNWYNKGKEAKSGKFKQFVCDVDNAQDIAAHRLESIVIESAADNPKDAKWLLTKKFPDIYGDRQYNETKIDATVESDVTVNLLDRVKEKRQELNDLTNG